VVSATHGRRREAAVSASFGVADATNFTGYDGLFETVLYHCLDDDGQLYRLRECSIG
jgi:hypothetical protein